MYGEDYDDEDVCPVCHDLMTFAVDEAGVFYFCETCGYDESECDQ